MTNLIETYKMDQQTWDECAETYEQQIVAGHPDILAFENFEEDFLDRLLRHLGKTQDRKIKLMDIGCGSGRLHLRYGAKTTNLTSELQSDYKLAELKENNSDFAYDPLLAEKLGEVWGIDFSKNMIQLAEDKLNKAGLNGQRSTALNFAVGSAFELEEQPDDILPVAICLVNSIGVMQGPEGAVELFKSMRNVVEAAKGIAIISCYQQEYIKSYGLGQYESTLDVSGQPLWLIPDTYANPRFKQIAKNYKRAHSENQNLIVDVYDLKGNLIKNDHTLKRSPDLVNTVIETGKIRTHSNYKSHWYSFNDIDNLIKHYWAGKTYHIRTKELDALRAEPAQMAILDRGNHLEKLFKLWEIN